MAPVDFPKGKGNLKPAYEPILLCRKPGPKVLPLGIDECRVPTSESWSYNADRNGTTFHGQQGERIKQTAAKKGAATIDSNPAGRWPANVVHDGSEEVLEAFVAFGERKAGVAVMRNRDGKVHNQVYGAYRKPAGDDVTFGDTGTAARFFYTAKASRRERNAGLEGMPEKHVRRDDGQPYGMNTNTHRPDGSKRKPVPPQANHHPTVKPLALMKWLVKLVAREGETVLDPMMGSGTTGIACIQTGRKFIGIEKNAEYFEIAQKRIAAAQRRHEKKQGLLSMLKRKKR